MEINLLLFSLTTSGESVASLLIKYSMHYGIVSSAERRSLQNSCSSTNPKHYHVLDSFYHVHSFRSMFDTCNTLLEADKADDPDVLLGVGVKKVVNVSFRGLPLPLGVYIEMES
ncbi:hypothetical protein Tco_1013873 [Tanacetum coccineum]